MTQRNGYRSRAWDTRVGRWSCTSRRFERGATSRACWSHGVAASELCWRSFSRPTWKGYPQGGWTTWSRPWGCEGISKSQVSRICSELDEVMDGFLGRPLDGGPYPYLWLDALTQKVREDGRIVNVSVVVATAVNGEGKREIIGMDVGTSEDGAFWLAFLRSLSARGLGGVELVVSDAHQGLRGAIAAVFGEQLATVPHPLHGQPAHSGPQARPAMGSHHGAHHLPAPSPDEVQAPARQGDRSTPDRFPQVASLLDEAGPDVLAFSNFPLAHWKKLLVQQPTGASQQGDPADAPMWWASSLTDRPCAASLASSSLSSTTNGPLAVDTSHLAC